MVLKALSINYQVLKCGKGTTVGTNELHSGSLSGQVNDLYFRNSNVVKSASEFTFIPDIPGGMFQWILLTIQIFL